MDSYTHVQCLFCETGKEQSIVEMILKYEGAHAIFAQRARFIKRDNDWTRVGTPLLPGYVFVYQDQSDYDEIDFHRIPYVFRVLKYDDGSTHLKGNDLLFSDWLWRMNGEIGVIKTVQIGDRMEIAEGALRELKGQIIHINRRQRKVYVVLDSTSIPIHTWLAYEQVQEINGKS